MIINISDRKDTKFLLYNNTLSVEIKFHWQIIAFSVLVVRLIEPIKMKKRAPIVRLCDFFGACVADYVKFWAFIVRIM